MMCKGTAFLLVTQPSVRYGAHVVFLCAVHGRIGIYTGQSYRNEMVTEWASSLSCCERLG
jgi:hypothetical protein